MGGFGEVGKEKMKLGDREGDKPLETLNLTKQTEGCWGEGLWEKGLGLWTLGRV